MTWQLAPETTGTLQHILLLIAVAAAAWYCGRIALAVILLASARRRPGTAALAVRAAPAGLRPLIRRAVVSGILGVTLTGTSAWAAPAHCEPGPGQVAVLDRAAACTVGSGGGTLASPAAQAPLPASPETRAPTAGTPQAPDPARTYRVRPGDSLWGITGSLLSTSDPGAIAAAWPELWRANRQVIGQDPGLIQPGIALAVPAGFGK